MKHPKSYDTDEPTRKRMAHVKLKGGDAEKLLAKRLWHLGFRYRKNDKSLPGSPDIAIRRYNIAIFVDGEFWHGKDWNIKKTKLKRNKTYWTEKIEENIARDRRVNADLKGMGWSVIRFWTQDVIRHTDDCVKHIEETAFDKRFEE